MRRRGTMRNRSGSTILVWAVIVMAIVSGYTASKYVAVPLMVSYRAAVDSRQSEQTAETEKQDSLAGVVTKQAIVNEQTPDAAEKKTVDDVVTGQQEIPEEKTKETVGSVKEQIKEAEAQNGALTGLYCIQFGSFTTRNAAETTVSQLAEKNISAFIKEKDGVFKVFSIPYDTKEKAKVAAGSLAGQVSDLFVVVI